MRCRRCLMKTIRLSCVPLLAAGFALVAGAVAQTISNPSFEENSFAVAPGYISANAAIPGWTASNTGRVGLNPANGTPSADNGAVPNGANVAFIQSTDIGSSTLSGCPTRVLLPRLPHLSTAFLTPYR